MSTYGSIMNVAKYILEEYGSMPTMRLHKYCYLCQGWSLAWDEVPLFDEDFVVYKCCLICKELYHTHKGKFSICAKDMTDVPTYQLSNTQKETIAEVIKGYSSYDGPLLNEVVRSTEPWLTAFKKGEGSVVDKEEMQQYFGGLV